MRSKLSVVLMVFFFLKATAWAEEVDDFYVVEPSMRDSVNEVNQLVDWYLQRAVSLSQEQDHYFLKVGSKFTCDRKKIIEILDYVIGGNWTDITASLSNESSAFRLSDSPEQKEIQKIVAPIKIQKKSQDKRGTVYEGTSYDIYGCCTGRIKINGITVGLDKIDHFFGNGGMLWQRQEDSKNALMSFSTSDLIKINTLQEHTTFGLNNTAIKSYGDLAANWAGIQFWNQVLDGPDPYFTCKNNKLSVRKKFDIRNYIDESWNESINCSSYKNSEDLKVIQSNLAKKNMSCPADKNICKKLADKYGKISKELQTSLLSPLCLNPDSKFSQIERPMENDWSDIVFGLRGLTLEIAWNHIRARYNEIKYKIKQGAE